LRFAVREGNYRQGVFVDTLRVNTLEEDTAAAGTLVGIPGQYPREVDVTVEALVSNHYRTAHSIHISRNV
jgi:hypothetical protein